MKKLIFFLAVCLLFMMTAASVKVNAQPSTDINTYVLFAYDQLSFKGGNQAAGWGIIYGNIGVNNAAPTSSYVSMEFATSGFAWMADGFMAVADHVRGDAGGSFYDLYANKKIGNFKSVIRNLGPVPFTPPIIALGSLPVFPFTPGPGRGTDIAPNLTVPKNAVITYNPPFLYHNVRIMDNATVTFGPGTFDMWNLDFGKNVTVNVDENTILQIDVKFSPNDHLQFGVGSAAGAKILVGAYGLNWTTTPATNSSHYSEIHASYFSPTGWLDIGGKSELFGHFWARKISGDANDNVYLPPPVTFPPPGCTCDPPFSTVYSMDIHDYALFAYNELMWKGGDLGGTPGFGYIYGNIGVEYAGLAHSGFALGFATSHGAWMGDGYQAVADNTRGGAGGSFYDLFTNAVDNNFASDIRDPLSQLLPGNIPALTMTTPLVPVVSLPVLPFTPGPGRGTDVAPNLTIAQNAVVTYNPPFTYHNVRINDGATVTFGPGTFNMWNLSIGKNVTINVDEFTILQIDVKFDPNNGLKFGLGTHAGAKILVGAYGLNPTTTQATNFSHGSEVHASYFAPTGALDLGGGNNLYGHFWALTITADPNNNVFCDCANGVPPLAPVGLGNPGATGKLPISIFPNPAKESFTLQINNSMNQSGTLTLQDMSGKEILRITLQLQDGVSNYPVSTASISDGIYIVRLQTVTGIGQTKLIINR